VPDWKPDARVYLTLVRSDGSTLVTVGSWGGLVAAVREAPDDVYEIRDDRGDRVGCATADGHGAWHVWGEVRQEKKG